MNTTLSIPLPQSRFDRFIERTNPRITPKMINALTAFAILSSVTGCGLIFAAWDTTIGMTATAIGSLVTAVITGFIAILNAKHKNKIEEMKEALAVQKAQMEIQTAQMEAQTLQMERQKHLSAQNRETLNTIQTAIAQNTVETVKSTVAASEVKQRVEQLEQKLPPLAPTQKIE